MQDIKEKAEEAEQDGTAGIEHELQQRNHEILDEIYRFRDQVLPSYPFSQEQDQERHRLGQWLDALTHYAESIMPSGDPREDSDAASIAEATAESDEPEEEPAHYEATNYILKPTSPPPPPPPGPSRYALPFPGLPTRTSSYSSTSGKISGSRGHNPAAGDFAVLEAYDPDWRDNFGPFLAKEGLADDDIRADQDFIVELMQYLAQRESDRPKSSSSSSSRGGQALRTAKMQRGSLERRRWN